MAGIVSTLVGSGVLNATRSGESCGSRACSGKPQVVPSVMLAEAEVKALPEQAPTVLPATITPVALAGCGLTRCMPSPVLRPIVAWVSVVVALPIENRPAPAGAMFFASVEFVIVVLTTLSSARLAIAAARGLGGVAVDQRALDRQPAAHGDPAARDRVAARHARQLQGQRRPDLDQDVAAQAAAEAAGHRQAEMATVEAVVIVKTRSERSLPPTVVTSAPEPWIVTSSVISRSPALS